MGIERVLGTLVDTNIERDTASNHASDQFWNTQTKLSVKILRGHSERVHAIDFLPDCSLLVSASNDKTARIWDTWSGNLIETLKRESAVYSVAFSACGKQIGCGMQNDRIWIWEEISETPRKSTWTRTNQITTEQAPFSIAFSPDGSQLAFGLLKGRTWVFDARSGSPLFTWTLNTGYSARVVFSHDGKWLASWSLEGTIQIQEVAVMKHRPKMSELSPSVVLEGRDEWVKALAFSPDGRWLASGGSSGRIHLWAVSPWRCSATLEGGGSREGDFNILAITFASNGERMASCNFNGEIKIWNLASLAPMILLEGAAAKLWTCAFSPNGKQIALGMENGTIQLWQVRSPVVDTSLYSLPA